MKALILAIVAAVSAVATEPKWVASSKERVIVAKGGQVTLAAIPFVPLSTSTSLNEWQGQAELKVGAKSYRLTYGTDNTVWRSGGTGTSYAVILEDRNRGEVVIGRGGQDLANRNCFRIYRPYHSDAGAKLPLPFLTINVTRWPSAGADEFPVTVVDERGSSRIGSLRWVTPIGRWTHAFDAPGAPRNAQWSWSKNGKPLGSPRGWTNLNQAGMVHIENFDPVTDVGQYVLRFAVLDETGRETGAITKAFQIEAGQADAR